MSSDPSVPRPLTAVILAAGLGSRLRAMHDGPKGLLVLGGVPLIERAVATLHAAGVADIVVVTGHRADHYHAFFAGRAAGLRFVHNPDYARTGSMHSLWLARELVPGDLLLIESDLLFEPRAITALVEPPGGDAVLLSGATGQGDEVFALGGAGRLRALTKRRPITEEAAGEFVGIARLTQELFAALCRHYETEIPFPSNYHYDDALTALAVAHPIELRKIPDLCWAEIDDEAQYARAVREVLPFLAAGRFVLPPRRILLNPGPCTTTDRVKAALVMPDLCPREEEFGRLVRAVRTKLLQVAPGAEQTHTVVLIGGSGTSAVEAALSSLVGPDDLVVVVENGAYGRRGQEIAQAHGLAHRVVRGAWGEWPNVAEIAAALDAAPRATHCFFVHHETTTGMLNPLAEIAAVCRERGVATMVDAISSFGGVPLDFVATPLDCLIGSANKCLQGMPGIGFVLVRPEGLARAAGWPARTVSLNLATLARAQEETGQFLFTPPVQVLHALDAALDEFFEEGAAVRHARYAACHAALRLGMVRLGFGELVPAARQSGILTAFLEPDDPAWNFNAMHDWMLARGITVYPGKLDRARTFRIANLGALRPGDLEHFVALLAEFLAAHGVKSCAPPTA